MSAESKGAIKAALLANGLIAVMKLVGAIMSGSASMLAEFKHSVGDWANGFFLLIGIQQSEKPADNKYNFGHGKKAFFWSFVASLGLLFIGGALSIYGGITKVIHPEPLEHVTLNLGILGLSILFELFSCYKATVAICHEAGDSTKGIRAIGKAFRYLSQSPPATRFVFLEDMAALLGLIIAGIAIGISVAADNTVFDGLASVIIGLILFAIGVTSAKDNMEAITGESADMNTTLEIGNFVKTINHVKDVNKIKSMSVGPNKYLFYLVLEADEHIQLKDLDDLAHEVEFKLKDNFEQVEFAHVMFIADNCTDDWGTHCKNVNGNLPA
ncbi:cation diffusion facilitator family transporter [Thermincola ferriacetica]|uniref:Cation diffusion facilitator family transporter n=1 Tax=Thermincola ferriacetica TaxID=281456 RepID=A0A0L6VZ29_9FIRM|nr:cation diffusion facilitator family transporter [Thermincola ferriacetica]KNZ68530.1 cation diffusion facilitator family transporter [Thermincola ferriacetica]